MGARWARPRIEGCMLHKAGAMAAFREKQGGLKANTKRKEVDIQIRGRQNVHAEKRCATAS